MPKRKNGPSQRVPPAQRQKHAATLTPPAESAAAEAALTARRLQYNASELDQQQWL